MNVHELLFISSMYNFFSAESELLSDKEEHLNVKSCVKLLTSDQFHMENRHSAPTCDAIFAN